MLEKNFFYLKLFSILNLVLSTFYITFDVGLPGKAYPEVPLLLYFLVKSLYVNIMLNIIFSLYISNYYITFASITNKQDKIMIWIFFLICVAVLVIDEAKNKHLDLKDMIKNMEE